MVEIKRAVVLGGGGVLGVAWESGLVQGLLDGGVDLRDADMFVGTSAGAICGVQLAAGFLPGQAVAPGASGPPPRPIKREELDLQRLGSVFGLWSCMRHADARTAAAIGEFALQVPHEREARFIAQIGGGLGVSEWPDKPLLVATVDTQSGERRVFSRGDGVDLQRVISASAAVPGMFPAIEIEDHRYMDGQVHSSTNADLLVKVAPEQVWIAAPTCRVTGQGIGPHAENMLEQEVAALHAAGCRVFVRMPRPEDAERFGANLMDGRRAADIYELGRETGRAWAGEAR